MAAIVDAWFSRMAEDPQFARFLAGRSEFRSLCRDGHIRQPTPPTSSPVIRAITVLTQETLAYYSPYCDAMFNDNEFRKLACQRNVDVPGRYGVRLFSETNRNQFMAYLDEFLVDYVRV